MILGACFFSVVVGFVVYDQFFRKYPMFDVSLGEQGAPEEMTFTVRMTKHKMRRLHRMLRKHRPHTGPILIHVKNEDGTEEALTLEELKLRRQTLSKIPSDSASVTESVQIHGSVSESSECEQCAP